MNRRQSLKVMSGATLLPLAIQSAANEEPKVADSTIYLGMCVGHYKHNGLGRADRVERLASKGFKYINSCSFQWSGCLRICPI